MYLSAALFYELQSTDYHSLCMYIIYANYVNQQVHTKYRALAWSSYVRKIPHCFTPAMVRALYYVIRPIPWYYGNPVVSHEIINVNTSKRGLFVYKYHCPQKKNAGGGGGESWYLSIRFFYNYKYFNTRKIY